MVEDGKENDKTNTAINCIYGYTNKHSSAIEPCEELQPRGREVALKV